MPKKYTAHAANAPVVSKAGTTSRPTNVCVFGGANAGRSAAHLDAARLLAVALHARGIHLVYGGGTTGVVGELARVKVALGGKESVHGIVPQTIVGSDGPGVGGSSSTAARKSGWFAKLHNLGQKYSEGKGFGKSKTALLNEDVYGKVKLVADLSERKKLMARAVVEGGPGSGFVALSGGFGTMDEVAEIITLHHHGVHHRRVCLYNVEHFWDGFIVWMGSAIDAGFVKESIWERVGVSDTADGCLEWFKEE